MRGRVGRVRCGLLVYNARGRLFVEAVVEAVVQCIPRIRRCCLKRKDHGHT